MSNKETFEVDPRTGRVVRVFQAMQPERIAVGFSPKQLAISGLISFGVARVLGATLPGAIVMGLGNILWESGSVNIPPGWRRYVAKLL